MYHDDRITSKITINDKVTKITVFNDHYAFDNNCIASEKIFEYTENETKVMEHVYHDNTNQIKTKTIKVYDETTSTLEVNVYSNIVSEKIFEYTENETKVTEHVYHDNGCVTSKLTINDKEIIKKEVKDNIISTEETEGDITICCVYHENIHQIKTKTTKVNGVVRQTQERDINGYIISDTAINNGLTTVNIYHENTKQIKTRITKVNGETTSILEIAIYNKITSHTVIDDDTVVIIIYHENTNVVKTRTVKVNGEVIQVQEFNINGGTISFLYFDGTKKILNTYDYSGHRPIVTLTINDSAIAESVQSVHAGQNTLLNHNLSTFHNTVSERVLAQIINEGLGILHSLFETQNTDVALNDAALYVDLDIRLARLGNAVLNPSGSQGAYYGPEAHLLSAFKVLKSPMNG